MITITPAAQEQIRAYLEAHADDGNHLHIAVRGGGTMNPQYDFGVLGGPGHPEDPVVEFEGFTLHVDRHSVDFLKEAVVDFVNGGFNITAPNATPPMPPPPEGPVAEKVQRIIDTQINPGIAGHGGFIQLVGLEGETAYVRMGGGCQGCGMAKVTLSQGVVKAIVDQVPEIERVVDITDHASGTNPYYQPSGK
ncbi:MAG: iron-sulfur cluster assembly accessory protein [Nitrospirae bacterium]|nr:MAG: iron-sulfur cluster assembly accessory protein [Nitrospirota bacterium]